MLCCIPACLCVLVNICGTSDGLEAFLENGLCLFSKCQLYDAFYTQGHGFRLTSTCFGLCHIFFLKLLTDPSKLPSVSVSHQNQEQCVHFGGLFSS